MKPLFILIAAFLLAGLAYAAPAAVRTTIVAEQTEAGARAVRPTPERPVYFAAYDGGYIEAGDPIAGETPPSAAVVAQAIQSALASQGFLAADATQTPTLFLVYHWGVLRPKRFPMHIPYRVEPNLKARLSLVTPSAQLSRIEDYLVSRRDYPGSPMVFINLPFVGDALEETEDGLYFIAVSAYDFEAAAAGRAQLWWETKFTTRSIGNAMVDALPALVRTSGGYFGRHFNQRHSAQAPLRDADDATEQNSRPFTASANVTAKIDVVLQSVLHEQRRVLTGESSTRPTTTIGGVRSSTVPPELTARIAAYQKEKAALHAALTAQMKSHPPGPATRDAIDAFHRQHAGRIATLARTREAIRNDLAKLSAGSRKDQSVTALLQEFSATRDELTGTASQP